MLKHFADRNPMKELLCCSFNNSGMVSGCGGDGLMVGLHDLSGLSNLHDSMNSNSKIQKIFFVHFLFFSSQPVVKSSLLWF